MTLLEQSSEGSSVDSLRKEKTANQKRLYEQLRSFRVLRDAWQTIRANGRQSSSKFTLAEIDQFEHRWPEEIRAIADRLRKKRFAFVPARGIPIAREGKAPRPIVLAPVRDRIVQRALLVVISTHSPARDYLEIQTSFGVSRERTVRHAIEQARNLIDAGNAYVARSDIRDFFTRIPRSQVIDRLAPLLQDDDFTNVLDQATSVELANRAALGESVRWFPDDETGVAQGSSLSPLFGNVFLRDFDLKMNGRGIVCLRYVDDFLILGRSEHAVRAAFRSARQWLGAHGLEVHEPTPEAIAAGKAFLGRASDGFDFLGCTLRRGLVCPSPRARHRLLERIEGILRDGTRALESPAEAERLKLTVARTLYDVGNVVKAWGNAFAFCNDRETVKGLDAKIDEAVDRYRYSVATRMRNLPLRERRVLLGVSVLPIGAVRSEVSPAASRHMSGKSRAIEGTA